MSEVNIGKKIQDHRKAKQLSIRDLAEATGLTASLISQLERNLTNPSINTLKRVSKALDVPLFSFFMDEGRNTPLVVRSCDRKKLVFPSNSNLAYELLTPDTTGAIEFLLMTLAPGASSSEISEGHEGEEVSYVIQGAVNLLLEEETIALHPGDSVRIPPFRKHRWENTAAQAATVIFAITPPTF